MVPRCVASTFENVAWGCAIIDGCAMRVALQSIEAVKIQRIWRGCRTRKTFMAQVFDEASRC
jgi:hypothetical protein